jgi:hypothetical protein
MAVSVAYVPDVAPENLWIPLGCLRLFWTAFRSGLNAESTLPLATLVGGSEFPEFGESDFAGTHNRLVQPGAGDM